MGLHHGVSKQVKSGMRQHEGAHTHCLTTALLQSSKQAAARLQEAEDSRAGPAEGILLEAPQ